MNKVDLHIHSHCSDGTLSVEEIIALAKDKNLTYFSICDHDTFKAYDEIDFCVNGLIMGIEISAYDYVNKKDVHILAYGMNSRKSIETICEKTLKQSYQISITQINRLQEAGYQIQEAAVKEIAIHSSSIYKQHIMQVMINNGYADSIYGDTYQKLFKNNGICCCDKIFPDIKDVIEAIHNDGGIAVLAHPHLSKVEAHINEYVSYGLDGIETYHSSQDEDAVRFAHHYARAFNLLETGGSDCHGLFGNEPAIGDVHLLMKDEEVCGCIQKHLKKHRK